MSRELIKSVVIKKDGVYTRQESSNVEPKYYLSSKHDGLTEIYDKQGKEGLIKDLLSLAIDGNIKFLKGSKITNKLKDVMYYYEYCNAYIYGEDKKIIELKEKINVLKREVIDLEEKLFNVKYGKEYKKNFVDLELENVKKSITKNINNKNKEIVDILYSFYLRYYL